ncbi:MAG TPA: molybdopterin cofactor-binding domain-containing protein [Rhizomicrobium sp.]|nr:molybdopterin cofactor-binding domain-containing protein [Rhizomicrobium sp.]
MPTRRTVILGVGGAAGALVVGYALWPSGRIAAADRLDAAANEKFITNWIKIASDDTITVVVPHCDMGTGTFTALAQFAADELDSDWSKMRAEQAPPDPVFANGAMIEGFALGGRTVPPFLTGLAANTFRFLAANVSIPGAGYVPQITGGSAAVRFTGMNAIRVAAAAARAMLVKAAAARWNVSAGDCETRANRVVHPASGRSLRYGELAAEAAGYDPSSRPPMKDRRHYVHVGKPVRRFDIPRKVNGTTGYGIDVALPGMLYAAIRISPVFGGRLVSIDESLAAAQRGVKHVVKLEDAVVVVADRYWRARDAAASLEPLFDGGANGSVTSETIRRRRADALNGKDVKNDLTRGSGAGALSAGRRVQAAYTVPYLAHSPMEPMNATALYKDGALEVWAGTQDGLGSRDFCARAAGLSLEKVTFHLLPMGGAFGRRLPGQWNYLTYAVRTAMAVPGVPVKLIFTREEDTQHDYYRPNVMSRFEAALGSDGMPVAWVNSYTTDDSANPEAHILYDIPNQSIGAVKVETHVPTGAWRSVEASWHGFFVESFVDELAHHAGKDPLQYRRALLRNSPRHLATLDLAAGKSGWGTPLPKGSGRGVAIVESFGTIVAHVAEVSIDSGGAVRVNRIVSAVDCGLAVNPDGLKAQIEGAILFGLTAALRGEITIDKGAVVQSNFNDYEMLRIADCPGIEVYLREDDGPVGGGGEPGVPPVAPAVANAVFAACGVRVRDLPLRNQSFPASGGATP